MRAISTRVPRLTIADTETFACYLREIRNRQPLTRTQEQAAFACYRQADADPAARARARALLMGHNQLFVLSVAKRHYRQKGPLTLLDLVQAGNEGLLEALDRFDETTLNKFISYAVWWVRKYMMDEQARYDSLVARPVHHYFRELREMMRQERAELQGQPDRDVPPAEVYVPRTSVISLDAGLEGEWDGYDLYPAESADQQRESARVEHLLDYTSRALAQLPPASARVLVLLFGLDGTVAVSKDYAAQELGVSVQTVKKMSERALGELKEILTRLSGCAESALAEEFLCG